MENIEPKKIMINCKEATYLYSKSLETKLNFANKLKLKIHLLMCKHCRHFSHQISEIETEIKKDSDISEENLNYHLTNNEKVEIKNEINQEKNK